MNAVRTDVHSSESAVGFQRSHTQTNVQHNLSEGPFEKSCKSRRINDEMIPADWRLSLMLSSQKQLEEKYSGMSRGKGFKSVIVVFISLMENTEGMPDISRPDVFAKSSRTWNKMTSFRHSTILTNPDSQCNSNVVRTLVFQVTVSAYRLLNPTGQRSQVNKACTENGGLCLKSFPWEHIKLFHHEKTSSSSLEISQVCKHFTLIRLNPP